MPPKIDNLPKTSAKSSEGQTSKSPRTKVKTETVAAPSATPDYPELNEAPVLAPALAKSSSKAKQAKAIEQRAKQARRASVMLKFVSDPTRLQVIMFLTDEEHHVGALCEQLGQSQPAVSHHLALLRHGGVITPRRMGKNNFYSLSNTGQELAKVIKILLRNGSSAA